MDKLKAQLAPVLNQWFWIATVVVILGSVAIWWMASGTLTTEFESEKSKITADASAITSVSGRLNEHPNPKTHAEMDILIKGREQEVLAAWTSIYKRQQSILVWPVAELKPDFVREFEVLTPIELKVPFPTPDDVEKQTSFLVRYRDYIGSVLPPIAAIAKAKWTADFDKASFGVGAVGTTDDMPMQGFPSANVIVDEGPLVVWPTVSQEKLLSDLFPWRGGQPSTLEVLYSQENLWILRQLMQIVASVNGDVAQRFQAKIHEINTVAIGSSVKNTAGVISKPEVDGTSTMSTPDYSSMSESGGMPSTMMGATVSEVDPGDNRYVDPAGKPVTASALRAALSSNSPTDAFMAVAKRIPVMLSLKMNQKAVPELLATCGSAQLMVELKQVRILAAGASGATAGGGGGGGSTGYGGGMEMSGMADAVSGPTGAPVNPFPLDMDVEIYGIIYIYNPPQAEKLGVEKVTEDTVIDGTAMIDGRKVEEPLAVVPEAVTAPEALPPPSAAIDAVAPAENNPIPPVEPAAPAPVAPAPVVPVAPAPVAPAPVAPPAASEVAPPAAGVHWNRKELTVRKMAAVA